MIGSVVLSIFILLPGSQEKALSNNYGAGYASSAGGSSLDFTIGQRNTQFPQPTKREEKEMKNDNLTDLLAQNYALEILDKNSKGTLSEDLSSDVENFINSLTQESDSLVSVRKFNSNDINTTNNNSEELKIKYIEAVDTALRKNFGSFRKDIKTIVDRSLFKNDHESIRFMIQNSPGFINDLLQIETPSDFEAIHIRMLNVWQKKLVMYLSAANVSSDPLKAYITMQWIPEIIEEEAMIQSILLSVYQEIKS